MTEDSRLHEDRLAILWRDAHASGDLLEVIAALYACEINVGLQAFYDGGFDAWFGDDYNGKRVSEHFEPQDVAEIPQWLVQTAEAYWPVLRQRRLGNLVYV